MKYKFWRSIWRTCVRIRSHMNKIMIYLLYTKYKDEEFPENISHIDFRLIKSIITLSKYISDYAGKQMIKIHKMGD